MNKSILLTIDGLINLALGILLLWFPDTVVDLLGVPGSDLHFYPNILGAMLFGIAIALFIELKRPGTGLGLYGAIAINLVGGIVLALWLMTGNLVLPYRGQLFLWILVIILIGISTIELWISQKRNKF